MEAKKNSPSSGQKRSGDPIIEGIINYFVNK